MAEKEPLRSATALVGWQLRNEVLPPNDRNLSGTAWRDRLRRMQESENPTRMIELMEILDPAPISPFFKLHLLEDLVNAAAWGFTNDSPIKPLSKTLYGIDLDENDPGFFDVDKSEKALEIEFNYFLRVLPTLQWKEQSGIKSAVNWRQWQTHLLSAIPEE